MARCDPNLSWRSLLRVVELAGPSRLFARWCSVRDAALTRVGVAFAALVIVCALIGTLLFQSHQEAEIGGIIASRNIANTIAADEARTIEVLDLSLQGVSDAILDPEVMASTQRLKRLILFDRAASAKDIDAILVLDSQGNIIVDSRFETPRSKRLGSRDFFRAHVDNKDRGLFISRPFLSPFDGEWNVGLSRRLNRADGSFFGVVLGIIRLDYFQRLFNPIDVGPKGSVSLIGFDGTVFMRNPYEDGQIGRLLNIDPLMARVRLAPSGSYEAVSALDGVQRLYNYKQVGTLPLVQVVGLAFEDLYREWRHRAIFAFGVTLLFCAAILGLVIYLQVELARRVKAEAAFAELAATDKLTGLPNRRKFDEVLAAEWQRSIRSKIPISLLMIDLDHFKAYNDEYGHQGGDAVLSRFAEQLRDAVRSSDYAARYGGEEFVLILPDTDSSDTAVVAERLRRRIVEMNEPHRGSPRDVLSISIGAATIIPSAQQGSGELIEAADVALYRAKAEGRNRVAFSQRLVLRNVA